MRKTRSTGSASEGADWFDILKLMIEGQFHGVNALGSLSRRLPGNRPRLRRASSNVQSSRPQLTGCLDDMSFDRHEMSTPSIVTQFLWQCLNHDKESETACLFHAE